MSDPRSKAERSKAKDIRQGAPQRAVIHGKRKKTEKPYQVWRRYIWTGDDIRTAAWYADWLHHADWRYTYHRFATLELAQQYIEKEQRSFPGSPRYRAEFEVRNADAPACG